MNWILIIWHRWCLDVARDELRYFQAREGMGSVYFTNTLTHIATLEHRIERLRAKAWWRSFKRSAQ